MFASQTNPRRAYWLKTMHQWHWISSAVCLLGMLLFAFTGITLNHSAELDSAPQIMNREAALPEHLRASLAELGVQYEQDGVTPSLPVAVADWVTATFSVDITNAGKEWSERELYLSMQQPGGDAWMSIKLRSGAVTYQMTKRGWIAYLNDLHKGRYTGTVWAWFMDLFSVACILFSLTGLVILKMHAGNRPSTWPLVGLGVIIPVLIALLLIH
jgi:uncharacterized protein